MNRDFSFRTIEDKNSLQNAPAVSGAGRARRSSTPRLTREQIVGFYIRGGVPGSGFITCRAKACIGKTPELGSVVKARDVNGRCCFHCAAELVSKELLEAMSL